MKRTLTALSFAALATTTLAAVEATSGAVFECIPPAVEQVLK